MTNANERIILAKDMTPGLVLRTNIGGGAIFVGRAYMVGTVVKVHLRHTAGYEVGVLESERGEAKFASNTEKDTFLF